MQHLLENLTDAQRQAVQHVEGPLLILAGPGSGKTRVVTHRIAHLAASGIPSHQILALTFTNKAADEMKARVEQLVPNSAVWVSTFHRFCARMLRKYAQYVGLQENYTIYDTQDSRRALKRALERHAASATHFTPDSIAAAISWAKNQLISPEDYQPRPGHALGAVVAQVYPIYQGILAKSNAADFDDLLVHIATLLKKNPELRAQLDQRFQFVLVDEYQDTNLAQYAIAQALSTDHQNLAVTGDPDQSIYGWRGANLKNILEFEKDFPNVQIVRLEQNYRSTKRILSVAAGLIAHNVRRKEKELFTDNDLGRQVRLVRYATQKDEAHGIAVRIADDVLSGRRRLCDFAVFYRINALSRALEFAFRDHGIPYQMVHGQEFFQRKEIKDVIAYLQLLYNPQNDIAFLRTINTPTRGIGKTTIQRLSDHAVRHGLTLLEAAQRCQEIESLNKRSVSLVSKFAAMIDRLSQVATGPVEEILGLVLAESGYKKQLETSKSEEDEQRLANIEELLSVGREFDEKNAGNGHLEEFLEEVSLVNETDDWESENDRVTLMTLHASKGLEFPVVYMIAVEDGLLPHERCRDKHDQLEEERRLMFVGLTRAEEELQISLAHHRDFRGRRNITVPSQFLMELPRDEMDVQEFPSQAAPWSEPSFDEPYMDVSPTELPKKQPTSTTVLTTAAELAGESAPQSLSPDEFYRDMLVRHPSYGLGRVVALSGTGPNRKATIDFAQGAGRKKFVITNSPLISVKRGHH